MHIYFSGIGGTGIGPLALIAHRAGFEVSGSDKQDSSYLRYLQKQGITDIHVGQSYEQIAAVHEKLPIDWFVYSSAVVKEQANPPEMEFCKEQDIKATKRDEFLSNFLKEKQLKLIAIAGTHGKTTTTAMTIWLFKQLGIPISYSVGAKLSFGEMGEYDPQSEYFVYEADEFDRNFLAFHPFVATITGLDWDHPDIYPTRESYNQAFQQFISQSTNVVAWSDDIAKIRPEYNTIHELDKESRLLQKIALAGKVNRENALLVAKSLEVIGLAQKDIYDFINELNKFPGLSRRFEQIAPHIYSDYAHTPPKIRGALQLAREVAGDNVVVVYEGLHNTRQHFIKDELRGLFDGAKQLYIVPSYLAREDKSLKLLAPEDLKQLLNEPTRARTAAAELNDDLKNAITKHADNGDLVLCLSAGGGNSLDEWLRREFAS